MPHNQSRWNNYNGHRGKVAERVRLWKKKHRERANLISKKSIRKNKILAKQEIDQLFDCILTNTRAYLNSIDETKLTAADRIYLRNNPFSVT